MVEKRASSAIRIINRHRLWRAIHIVTALFVLSYISFQVLDLDLSDFPTSESSGETSLAIVEASESTELASAINETSFRVTPSLVDPAIKESIRFQQKNLLQHTRVRNPRTRLHRLTVPRSSPVDASAAD